jgi:peroxiredoxin
VAWTGNESSFQDFIDRHGLTFPQISDDPGDIYDRFDIPAQPALVLVDSDGDVQTMLGAVEADTLDSALEDLTSP